MKNLPNEKANIESKGNNLLTDIEYICRSNDLIVDSLRNGAEVAQLPNGDIIITEVKTISTQYKWHKSKKQMVKVGQ